MRLRTRSDAHPLLLVVLAWLALWPAAAAAQSEGATEAEVEDILGTLVVEATKPENLGRKLVSVAVEPSLGAAQQDVILHNVVTRDLDLSGDFRVLDSNQAPASAYTSSSPPELEAWRKTGVEALIRLVGGATQAAGNELRAEIYWLSSKENPLYAQTLRTSASELRRGAHHIADAVIGALTGHAGGFASHLTFTSTSGGSRRAFTIDSDGHDLRVASGSFDVVAASGFGNNDEFLFTASVNYGPFQVYEAGKSAPWVISPRGSVYGFALDHTRNRLAVALGVEGSVHVLVGDLANKKLERVSKNEMAFHPTFSPTGKLAYVGVDDNQPRIVVEGKSVSPRGLRATSPVFCNHANGTQLVYAIGVGQRTDLVASDEKGNGARRLTRGPGTNSHAACSPDGRLVAFFSTRKSHEGPGLYVLPLLGGKLQRISSSLGDSLRWEPLRKPLQVVGNPTEQ
jgi:TolB protein